MCNKVFNSHLAPLSEKHLEDVKKVYPNQAEFADDLYGVLTKNLVPQVNLLVSFVALKELLDKGARGIFEKFGEVLYVPLSIVAKTDDHEWTRFRPQPVEELHTSFLSFRMAKTNNILLNQVLGKYGLCFSADHCCGIVFGKIDDVKKYKESNLCATRNEVRSYAESMAMPVENVSFEELPMVTSDLGETEMSFYQMYEETFGQMEEFSRDSYVDQNKETQWNEVISQIANPLSIKERETKKVTA